MTSESPLIGRDRARVAHPATSGGLKLLLAAGAVVLLAALPYLRAGGHGFVSFDDDDYVAANPAVRSGLTGEGVRWALTTSSAGNWHPLTWISLMADVELFGVDPGALHLVNVFLHAAAAAFLFLALHRMTGALWRSLFVAALFGIHPSRVESVAWIAERKDVLSGLFFALALFAYGRYVRRPRPARYLCLATCLALGLAAKPMLVTLPFLLLLLDLWPLGRARPPLPEPRRRWSPALLRRLALEKLPLLLLAAAAGSFAYAAQQRGGMIRAPGFLTFPERLANALVSYAAYLRMALWPADLAVLYPYPWDGIPPWKVAAALALLVAATAAAVAFSRSAPALFTGWFWFLGLLVPVIGLIPIGNQAMADRYSYLPLIGLFLAVSWGIPRLVAADPGRARTTLVATASVTLLALAAATGVQVGHWKNNETLYAHALSVTANNTIIHNSLGAEYFRQGRIAEAVPHFREALRIRPDYADAHNNLGLALSKQGRMSEAMAHMREAFRLESILSSKEYRAP